jgi:hypothetical protein
MVETGGPLQYGDNRKPAMVWPLDATGVRALGELALNPVVAALPTVTMTEGKS